MTRKALRSEQWCTEERAAESSTDSCSCLTERALLTLKLLLKLLELLELLRHRLNDVLKLVELLRDDLKQLLKLLKQLLLQLEILHRLKLLWHELERLLRHLLLPRGYAKSLRAVRRRCPEL